MNEKIEIMGISLDTCSVEEIIESINVHWHQEESLSTYGTLTMKLFMEAQKDPELKEYLIDICERTRSTGEIIGGVSPRGTIAFYQAVRAYAYVQNRDFAVPEDIKKLAVPVLSHRMILGGGFAKGDELIARILEEIPVPTEEWGK